jgi:hypothetical protein
MTATPKNDDSSYDPEGTSHLFEELVYCASMLEWNFDEQIDGAPAELLYQWGCQLLAAESCLADIKRELEKMRLSAGFESARLPRGSELRGAADDPQGGHPRGCLKDDCAH